MKIWIKKSIFWTLAVIISVGAMVFQRKTGPTYPMEIEFISGEEIYKFELPRTHGGETDCPVEIELPNEFEGEVIYRRYPSGENWDTIQFKRVDENLIAGLPSQPPAGKIEYHINISKGNAPVDLNIEENIVIRFKGEVPGWALTPHIIFIILAMLWSNATGLLAAANIKSYKRNILITLILFIIGGMIFGPIVQKFAFGAYWTGWPNGKDLTDNKVLISLIVWIAALVFNQKKDRQWIVILAALLLFAIYMIPHSMRGSELNLETGEVVTGSILLLAIVPGKLFKKRLNSFFTRPIHKKVEQ
jgi:hypothetical protein